MDNEIQLFVLPPSQSSTRTIRVNPHQTTVEQLRNVIVNGETSEETTVNSPSSLVVSDGIDSSPFGDSHVINFNSYEGENNVRLSVRGKDLFIGKQNLIEEGLMSGDVIRTSGRLCGGGALNIQVHTKFAFVCCCNHCTCDCCSNGTSLYLITVS
jgi:hypothetical protein